MLKKRTQAANEDSLTIVELLKPLPKVDWASTTSFETLDAW